MRLIELLVAALIMTILASIALPVITKAYDRAQWDFLVASSRNRSRIEAALIDEPNQADKDRFEFLVTSPLRFKKGEPR